MTDDKKRKKQMNLHLARIFHNVSLSTSGHEHELHETIVQAKKDGTTLDMMWEYGAKHGFVPRFMALAEQAFGQVATPD